MSQAKLKSKIKSKISIAIGIIINSENKVCLTKRQDHQTYANFWEFPGGKVDSNEKLEDALVRELEEEIGIKVSSFDFMNCLESKTPSGRPLNLNFYKIKDYTGEPKSCEGQKLEWVAMDSLKDYKLLPANKPILKVLCS
jgi:8-oxo-dGTP diphosphatase